MNSNLINLLAFTPLPLVERFHSWPIIYLPSDSSDRTTDTDIPFPESIWPDWLTLYLSPTHSPSSVTLFPELLLLYSSGKEKKKAELWKERLYSYSYWLSSVNCWTRIWNQSILFLFLFFHSSSRCFAPLPSIPWSGTSQSGRGKRLNLFCSLLNLSAAAAANSFTLSLPEQ